MTRRNPSLPTVKSPGRPPGRGVVLPITFPKEMADHIEKMGGYDWLRSLVKLTMPPDSLTPPS